MQEILAKSKNEKQKTKEQTLTEHNEELLKILNIILDSEEYSLKDKLIMKIVCLCHDLGKMNTSMQEKLKLVSSVSEDMTDEEKDEIRKKIKNIKSTRHNVLSGAFLRMILDRIQDFSIVERELIYKAVMLHHGKYEDYVGINNTKIQEDVFNLIEEGIFNKGGYNLKDIQKQIEDVIGTGFKFDSNELDYEFIYYLSEMIKEDDDKIKYIMYKGLLNLTDHTASSGEKDIAFYNPFNEEQIDEMARINIAEKLNKRGFGISPEDVRFTALQDKLRKLSDENVLTTAFTGAGKTAADYRKSFKRKFFLVPNKISAESFYEDSIFKDTEYAGILHGDINLYLEEENKSGDDFTVTLRDINLTRNFCKPYIIATVDQILLSMFKFPGYEKVFAAIRNSSITVDEVHLLEPRMFLILLYFIQFSAKYFNTDFHLMTATLPKAYKEQMLAKNFTFTCETGKIQFYQSIESEEISDGKNLKCQFIVDKKIDEIIKEALKGNKKVLIVKNTIDEAIKAYEGIKKSFPDKEINLLHSRFKFEDKADKYKGILEQRGHIWVSTQAVEIALDLDFHVIISDLAPIDCLVQRMGRCNRHDMYPLGEFYLLPNRDDIYNKKLKEITKKTIEARLKSQRDNIITLKDRKDMLDEYYENKDVNRYFEDEFNACQRDIKSIYGISTDSFDATDLMLKFEPFKNIADNKKEAAKLFRDVDTSYKVILKDDFEEDTSKIQLKTIQVSKGVYYKLSKADALERKDGYILIRGNSLFEYNKDKGLYHTDART